MIKRVVIETKYTCRRNVRGSKEENGTYVSGRVFRRMVFVFGFKVVDKYDYQVVLPTQTKGCSEKYFNEAINMVVHDCEEKVMQYRHDNKG